MDEAPQQSLCERLAAIAEFLPLFEAPDFQFGEWDNTPGHMPYFMLSAEALQFVHAASANGWVTPRVAWVEWKDTPHAQQFATDISNISHATAWDLECLLTTLIRQNRFVEGALASAFESGMLTAIVHRAGEFWREVC